MSRPQDAEELIGRIIATARAWTLVRKEADFLELEKREEARWLFGKVAVVFEAAMVFDHARRRIVYGERLTEKGVGLAPPQGGSFFRKSRQQGARVEIQTRAVLPQGAAARGELGALRRRVETLAREGGWDFQAAIGKPKR